MKYSNLASEHIFKLLFSKFDNFQSSTEKPVDGV